MAKRVLLFSGGKIDLEFAAEYLQKQKFDMVVCADSGLNAAYHLGVPVDYIMGDFDSVATEVLERYRCGKVGNSADVEFIQYPREKDATDTEMVIEWILDRDASEIVILGATGGRLDHFLANLNLLMLPLARRVPAWLIDKNNKICLVDSDYTIRRQELFGKYISLQPLTEKVTGVTLRGFQYLLDDFTMTIGSSRGVSNEMAENADAATITFRKGILIVVESRD